MNDAISEIQERGNKPTDIAIVFISQSRDKVLRNNKI